MKNFDPSMYLAKRKRRKTEDEKMNLKIRKIDVDNTEVSYVRVTLLVITYDMSIFRPRSDANLRPSIASLTLVHYFRALKIVVKSRSTSLRTFQMVVHRLMFLLRQNTTSVHHRLARW